ncbi:MAG TPA: hypothetical protein PK581_01820 [Caldisericia bacterium]|nr:hypothetical protein [Caldisericia bacterium]
MNTKSTSLLPWFEALKFSLRLMHKSFFKLFIPSMVLSFVMGALLSLIVLDAWFIFTHAPYVFPMIVLFICVISLPIYAYLYPLLKRHVLFLGMQELNLIPFEDYKELPRKIRFSNFLRLVKVSLKRYSFQSLSFLLLILLPITISIFLYIKKIDTHLLEGIEIVLLLSIIALLPVTWGFYAYFFAELHVIDKISQEVKAGCIRNNKVIRPDKKLFWPILIWKALMFMLYIVLLFALGQLYILSGNAFSSFDNYRSGFVLAMLYEISPVLLFGFLFHPFFEPVLNAIFKLRPNQDWFVWSYRSSSDIFLDNPIALWIMLFFLLLFGLLTAFFFLVETLSSVYFYHSAQRKMENSSLSGVDLEEA